MGIFPRTLRCQDAVLFARTYRSCRTVTLEFAYSTSACRRYINVHWNQSRDRIRPREIAHKGRLSREG